MHITMSKYSILKGVFSSVLPPSFTKSALGAGSHGRASPNQRSEPAHMVQLHEVGFMDLGRIASQNAAGIFCIHGSQEHGLHMFTRIVTTKLHNTSSFGEAGKSSPPSSLTRLQP
jgi:hypothetical protein